MGWTHADMQVRPECLAQFFDYANDHENEKLYLQGHRTKRSPAEQLFMHGESLFCSLIFQRRLYDVPAMPIIFPRDLLNQVKIDEMPDDFSIDIYVHALARKLGFSEKRLLVDVMKRENGKSAWNRGLRSKIKLSWKLMRDCVKIRIGKKVTA